MSRSAPRISERSIEDTCTQWLQLDGWDRVIKTDLAHLRGLGVQEKGMADRGYIRYMPNRLQVTACHNEAMAVAASGLGAMLKELLRQLGGAQVLWIEWKARDGKVGQKQKDWHTLERARGALVWVAKQDFPPTIDGFQDFYRKSGLLERKGL